MCQLDNTQKEHQDGDIFLLAVNDRQSFNYTRARRFCFFTVSLLGWLSANDSRPCSQFTNLAYVLCWTEGCIPTTTPTVLASTYACLMMSTDLWAKLVVPVIRVQCGTPRTAFPHGRGPWCCLCLWRNPPRFGISRRSPASIDRQNTHSDIGGSWKSTPSWQRSEDSIADQMGKQLIRTLSKLLLYPGDCGGLVDVISVPSSLVQPWVINRNER